MLNREYWPVERYSVKWPATPLLNGMLPKLVAATLPVLVVRKTFSKSTNPPGVNSAPPMRKERGDSLRSVSCGGASDAGCTAAFTLLLEVCRDASTTLGVASVVFADAFFATDNCCSRVWIWSCCCEICFSCVATASRSCFNSSATDGAEAESVFELFWPSTTTEVRIRKHNPLRNLIELLSSRSRLFKICLSPRSAALTRHPTRPCHRKKLDDRQPSQETEKEATL